MESYVVHIHRRPDAAGGSSFAGVVERVDDSAATRPFASLAELLALLDIAAAAVLPPQQRRN